MKKYLFFSVITVALLLLGIFVLPSSSEKTEHKVLGTQTSFTGLQPQQFSKEMSSGSYLLLDIRTMNEYNAGHLLNAEQIDFYQTQAFSDYLDTLDKDEKYLIYCRSGNRSRSALSIMKQKGFTQVWDLEGGYNAWAASGYPIER